jgi:hypothetical protein
VPWKDIGHIEHYPGILAYEDRMKGPTSGAAVVLAIKGGCLTIPALLVLYVFFPVFSVLSPWHARVTVYLTNGEKLVLRDLAESREFSRMVEYKLEQR